MNSWKGTDVGSVPFAFVLHCVTQRAGSANFLGKQYQDKVRAPHKVALNEVK